LAGLFLLSRQVAIMPLSIGKKTSAELPSADPPIFN
jgi:hypothetical protein